MSTATVARARPRRGLKVVEPEPATVRCAIYTRKSTEEGLDSDFNSLDAPREAGEAYVQSQRAEGWACLPDRYDGGFTGGNIKRPALQRLLDDIRAGKVDCVVVDGDVAVIGAYNATIGGYNNGAAYVFYRNQGGADNWGFVKKLTSSDTGDFYGFGGSIAIDADTLVVGASGATVGGSIGNGAAYVFYRDQGGADNWGEV